MQVLGHHDIGRAKFLFGFVIPYLVNKHGLPCFQFVRGGPSLLLQFHVADGPLSLHISVKQGAHQEPPCQQLLLLCYRLLCDMCSDKGE